VLRLLRGLRAPFVAAVDGDLYRVLTPLELPGSASRMAVGRSVACRIAETFAGLPVERLDASPGWAALLPGVHVPRLADRRDPPAGARRRRSA
jgi:hypothetical protein